MITSVNLAGTPFQSSTDSTRLQMASKQIQQTLTHHNCEIPYVIDDNYDFITRYSELGICLAKENGTIVFSNSDIVIVNYINLCIDINEFPQNKKTLFIYVSQLRFVRPK